MHQEKYLSRAEASEFCKARGIPAAKNTLQKLATVGGGPSYRKFGNRVLYTEADLLTWIDSRLSAPRSNTSEGGAQ